MKISTTIFVLMLGALLFPTQLFAKELLPCTDTTTPPPEIEYEGYVSSYTVLNAKQPALVQQSLYFVVTLSDSRSSDINLQDFVLPRNVVAKYVDEHNEQAWALPWATVSAVVISLVQDAAASNKKIRIAAICAPLGGVIIPGSKRYNFIQSATLIK